MRVKIMLVDDEPIAVQAMAVMLKKTGLEHEVVGKCFSGREAISRAEELHPEIIIMDIQMPGINGLEAMRRIKQHNPRTTFIVLSAYNEFSYAVEALSIGAKDYLLKPVTQSDFSVSIQNAAADICARKEDMEHGLRQQERLQIALPMIKKDFIRALLPSSEATEPLLACSGFLDLTGRQGTMVAIQGFHDTLPPERILDSLPFAGEEWIADMASTNLLAVFYPLPKSAGQGEDFLQTLACSLELMLKELSKTGKGIQAGVGGLAAVPTYIRRSFREALIALGQLKPKDGPQCMVFNPGFMETPENEPLLGEDGKPSSMAKIIEKATIYIQQNHHKELTLDEVASQINLSPYYFSRLFREITGETFSDNLFNARLAHAKYLLGNTNQSIKDIAYQVGYRDPNYFSRVFHKATGVKATEYRNLCSEVGTK